MSEQFRNLAYLVLGSNIEPERYLAEAVRLLSGHGQLLAVSRVWETPAAGLTAQPNFLNAAVLLRTPLSAARLEAQVLKPIERMLDRVRDASNRNAPRTIDIDLALFNRDTLTVGHRRIPDPAIERHAFVAVPLAELDPDYVHPANGRTLARIAAELQARCGAMRLRDDVVLTGLLQRPGPPDGTETAERVPPQRADGPVLVCCQHRSAGQNVSIRSGPTCQRPKAELTL